MQLNRRQKCNKLLYCPT